MISDLGFNLSSWIQLVCQLRLPVIELEKEESGQHLSHGFGNFQESHG